MCFPLGSRSSNKSQPYRRIPAPALAMAQDRDDQQQERYRSFAFVGVGTVGRLIVRQMLTAQSVDKLSILTHHAPDRYAEFGDARNVEVISGIDYSDPDSLTAALSGHDVVISTFSTMHPASVAHQLSYIRTARRAGIKLFVLSEFGFDIDALKPESTPTFIRVKYEARQLAEEVSVDNDDFVRMGFATDRPQRIPLSCDLQIGLPWLGIQAGLYLSVFLNPALAFDVKQRKARIVGSGDRHFPVSAETDVARFVKAVFTTSQLSPAQLESVRSLRMHSFCTSFNQALLAAQHAQCEKPWAVERVGVEPLQALIAEGIDDTQEAHLAAWLLINMEAGQMEVLAHDHTRAGNFRPMLTLDAVFSTPSS
ncbi:hypothetical protein OC844_003927 [Tilletia horrida]|nr:hypothetical protein OC844_003927 [Tilletia horrida]